jgi:hypothetical protein
MTLRPQKICRRKARGTATDDSDIPASLRDRLGGPRRGAELRLQVKPKNTAVYVDGYYTGTVDDFDGLFQHLRVEPGQHELVLYLQGYRTIRQTLNLRPGSDYKVHQEMVKLGAGETSEPPPAPPRPDEGAGVRGQEAQGENPPPPPGPPYRPRRPGARRPPMRGGTAEAAGYGVLSIRVQPADAEVIIDGDRWQGAEGAEPLVVHLAQGTHRVEVRKEGYAPFSSDVRVQEGETSPLNVSLQRRN